MQPVTSLNGAFRTSRDVRRESGMRIKAEVRQPRWIHSHPVPARRDAPHGAARQWLP